MKALISVYDKTEIETLGASLVKGKFELVSTGGTYNRLTAQSLPVKKVSDLTNFPEILDGRVKTLHPVIYGGILGRREVADHRQQMLEHGIDEIGVVVANLYPFVATVSDPAVSLLEALENIDIGGPAMIRAAAKNFPSVIIIVDSLDYGWVGKRISSGGEITFDERRELARKAFQHVAMYDTAISTWLNEGTYIEPKELTVGLQKMEDLRYGENPHQAGAVYQTVLGNGGIVRSEQLHGLPMSYTNFLDADSAWTTVNDFQDNACVVVKHTNPCGISVHPDQSEAYHRAFDGDSVSAYGGIVGFNKKVTSKTAAAMRRVLFDIIVAPDYDQDALEILRKRKRTRLLKAEISSGPMSNMDLKTISGGGLLQTADNIAEDPNAWKVVTDREPTEREWCDLIFSWKCLRHIKSNTIVLAKEDTLVGMGAGQPNRVVSIHLALRIAGGKAVGSSLASDAFMPFADNIEMAASGGVVAVAQPGGSIRDGEVIDAANAAGITMVFTGVRHFNH